MTGNPPLNQKIELIGGPLCGERRWWDADAEVCGFQFGEEWAFYRYEGNGKAVCFIA